MRKDFKRGGGSPAWTRKEGKSESGGLIKKVLIHIKLRTLVQN